MRGAIKRPPKYTKIPCAFLDLMFDGYVHADHSGAGLRDTLEDFFCNPDTYLWLNAQIEHHHISGEKLSHEDSILHLIAQCLLEDYKKGGENKAARLLAAIELSYPLNREQEWAEDMMDFSRIYLSWCKLLYAWKIPWDETDNPIYALIGKQVMGRRMLRERFIDPDNQKISQA